MKGIFHRRAFWSILVILLLAVFIYPPFMLKRQSGIVAERTWGWVFSPPEGMEIDLKMLIVEGGLALLVTIGVCLIPFRGPTMLRNWLFSEKKRAMTKEDVDKLYKSWAKEEEFKALEKTCIPQDLLEAVRPDREEPHPVGYSALIHLRLVSIHPFIDGNGRTARLLMNLALLQAGYGVTIIPPVLRREYLDSLKASNRGDNKPFVNLMIGMVYESQKDYLRILQTLNEK